jgi:hypothetical protein
MHRSLVLAAGAVCFATAACSSGSGNFVGVDSGQGGDSAAQGDAGAEAGCVMYTPDADTTTPTVSFAKDVLPTFQRSCGIAGATCHGTTSVMQVDQRPYLGNFDGGTDAAVVVTGIVGVSSPEDPSLSIVKAGDPANSYLMHKLDGDQCQFAAGCAQGQTSYTDCGQQMPYSSSALDQSTRDTIRRWIAQGAKND